MFGMHSLPSLLTLAFTFALTLEHVPTVCADSHGARDVALRRHRAVNVLEPRAQFENARFTFYKTGMGACGKTNSDDDFIVAMNVPQWNGGQHCFESITISYQGKTTQAQVVDECMGCPFGGIDLSPGLFSFLTDGNMDAGTVYGEWSFGSGDPPKPSTTSKPPPPPTTSETPTSTPPPPPTTTSTHKPPSTKVSTSSTFSSSSVSSSSSSVTPSSTSSSASATPTPTQTIEQGTLNSINQAFLGLSVLVALQAGQAN